MLLIGFVWVFIGLAALIVAKPLAPGKWEDTGPAAMMTSCLGAYLAGSLVVLVLQGGEGFGSPPFSGTLPGIVASLIGGVIGFGAYVADARRQAHA